jgi:hypothetical protein
MRRDQPAYQQSAAPEGQVNYLATAANLIRSEVSEKVLPKANTDQLFLIYAVLLFAKGAQVTCEDVHNAWTAWMLTRGKEHRSMVEFDRLAPATQAEDQPFVDAIVGVAARYAREGRA